MTTARIIRCWTLPLVCLLLAFATSHALHAQTAEEVERDRTATARQAEEEESSSAHRYDAEADEYDSEADERTRAEVREGTPAKDTEVKAASPGNVSPLGAAARRNTKEKKSVRSFTDADLSSAKGKLIIVTGTNVREPEIVPVEKRSPAAVNAAQPDAIEKANLVQRRNAIKALREKVAALEVEVRLLEDDYYMIEEEDHREVIDREFAQKREALAAAKEELAALQNGAE